MTSISPPNTLVRMPETDIRATAGVNDAVLAVGRVIFAVIFVASGIEKFMGLDATAAEIASKGLPMPQVFAIASAALEFGGGLLIVLGWQTRIVAFALALFTLAAVYFFHDFWHMQGAERADNMIHAMKNLSIFGGFLMLAAVGAGRYSIDGPCTMHEGAGKS
jgi:putative oxidoreductase